MSAGRLAHPVVEYWCQDCEGHWNDGHPCRKGPRGFGCCVKSHWRAPRRVGESEAVVCRIIGHDVREEVRESLDTNVFEPNVLPGYCQVARERADRERARPRRTAFLDRVR